MLDKSYHYLQVQAFMLRAGQTVPTEPTLLSDEDRLTRARLTWEEAMEKIHALGIEVYIPPTMNDARSLEDCSLWVSDKGQVKFKIERQQDFIGIIDGCLDQRVIATGTLVSMGVPDALLQMEVDENNLKKFAPGGYRNDEGKWVKPPDHKPPRIQELLRAMFPTNEVL